MRKETLNRILLKTIITRVKERGWSFLEEVVAIHLGIVGIHPTELWKTLFILLKLLMRQNKKISTCRSKEICLNQIVLCLSSHLEEQEIKVEHYRKE
jgi:hypothetical protein